MASCKIGINGWTEPDGQPQNTMPLCLLRLGSPADDTIHCSWSDKESASKCFLTKGKYGSL